MLYKACEFHQIVYKMHQNKMLWFVSEVLQIYHETPDHMQFMHLSYKVLLKVFGTTFDV